MSAIIIEQADAYFAWRDGYPFVWCVRSRVRAKGVYYCIHERYMDCQMG